MVSLRKLFGQKCPRLPRHFGVKQPNRADLWPPTVYHPTNQTRTNAVMAAAERRKQEQDQMRNTHATGLPSLHLYHHHSMNNPIGGYLGRPDINQAHTFPTSLTSASSITGKIESSDEKFQTRCRGLKKE
jgi:hypothetical protein